LEAITESADLLGTYLKKQRDGGELELERSREGTEQDADYGIYIGADGEMQGKARRRGLSRGNQVQGSPKTCTPSRRE
jgi:hypothetical protein